MSVTKAWDKRSGPDARGNPGQPSQLEPLQADTYGWFRPRCAASDPASSQRLFLAERPRVGSLPLMATLIGIAQASKATSEPRRPA